MVYQTGLVQCAAAIICCVSPRKAHIYKHHMGSIWLLIAQADAVANRLANSLRDDQTLQLYMPCSKDDSNTILSATTLHWEEAFHNIKGLLGLVDGYCMGFARI